MPADSSRTTPRKACLFHDRHHASEDLGFGPLGEAGLDHAVVIALSLGAVEIGFPFTYVHGGSLHLLPMEAAGMPAPPLLPAGTLVLDRRVRPLTGCAPRITGLEGRNVVLVDDGLSPITALADAARALRRGAPRRLVLGVPVLAPLARQIFSPTLVDQVYSARRGSRIAPGIALYHCPEPPPIERVWDMLQDVLNDAERAIPALTLADTPTRDRASRGEEGGERVKLFEATEHFLGPQPPAGGMEN